MTEFELLKQKIKYNLIKASCQSHKSRYYNPADESGVGSQQPGVDCQESTTGSRYSIDF